MNNGAVRWIFEINLTGVEPFQVRKWLVNGQACPELGFADQQLIIILIYPDKIRALLTLSNHLSAEEEIREWFNTCCGREII